MITQFFIIIFYCYELCAELSYQLPQKPPDTTTTASRNHTVICPHPGKKHNIFNTTFHTKNTTTNNVFCTKTAIQKQPQRAPGLRLTARAWDIAYGSLSTPQGGRARPSLTKPSGASNLRILYGANDLKPQKNYYTAQKHYSTQKITRVTHALLCCACMSTVLNLPCTHVTPTGKYPTRELPNPHPKSPPCRHRRLTGRRKTRQINF